MRRIVLGLVVFVVLIHVSVAAEAGPLRIGIVPYYAPEKIWQLFTPFVDHLKGATGLPWELRLYATHDAMVESICRGEVAVAFLGPVPFARVDRKCRVRPLLVARGADGTPTYSSVVVTTSPDIRTLKDLIGKPFGFFEGSTAAHVLPWKMLADAGITPARIQPVPLKGQDRIVDALLKREIAGAGIKKTLYEKFRNSGLRTLAESKPVPNFIFCATAALKPVEEDKFVRALLALSPMENEADRNLMKEWDDEIRNGFVPPPNSYRKEAKGLLELFDKLGK